MKIRHSVFRDPEVVFEKGDVVACYFCNRPCVIGKPCPWCGKPSPGTEVIIKKGGF